MKPATALSRVLANIVDIIAVNLLPVLLSQLILPQHPAWALLGFLFGAAYFTHFTASPWQATPGQRLLGMHVVRSDGRMLDKRMALVRFLAFCMPELPMHLSQPSPETVRHVTLWLAIVWFLPILVRSDKRGVHDLLSDSRVVAGNT